MNKVNKKITENLVDIGRQNCSKVVFEKEKQYLVRLSNGLCIVTNGDVTERFGGNAVIELSGEPGIYSYGDGCTVDKSYKPRLLFRIMDVKEIGGPAGNCWEKKINKDLELEKLKIEDPDYYDCITKWKEVDGKYRDLEEGKEYLVEHEEGFDVVKIIAKDHLSNRSRCKWCRGFLNNLMVEIQPSKKIDYIEFDHVDTHTFLFSKDSEVVSITEN